MRTPWGSSMEGQWFGSPQAKSPEGILASCTVQAGPRMRAAGIGLSATQAKPQRGCFKALRPHAGAQWGVRGLNTSEKRSA